MNHNVKPLMLNRFKILNSKQLYYQDKNEKVICYALLISALFMVSCRKDNNHGLSKQQIFIGNYSGMFVDSTVKTIEASYNGYSEILLDFDKNDSNDLRLVVALYGSPGMGVHPLSELQSLNSRLEFCGAYTHDTLFLSTVITNFSDEYNNYQSITDYYNCRKLNPDDEVFSTDTTFHITKLNRDDKISLSDFYASETISFVYFSFSPTLDFVRNDTVFRVSSQRITDCNALPYGQDIYIGIRLRGSVDRLGWIKILLHSENVTTLKEYALQNY
jgi:hypothetical protein